MIKYCRQAKRQRTGCWSVYVPACFLCLSPRVVFCSLAVSRENRQADRLFMNRISEQSDNQIDLLTDSYG